MKDLQDTALMIAGHLPDAAAATVGDAAREELRAVLNRTEQLSGLAIDTLRTLVGKQRQCFAGKLLDDDEQMQEEIPPKTLDVPAEERDEVRAYFQPCNAWQRPS